MKIKFYINTKFNLVSRLLNIDFFLKKQHIFKKRYGKKRCFKSNTFTGTTALTSIKQQRFDFIYIRALKKLFKRKYHKDKIAFFKPKYWLFLNINIILTAKSKNSRMGAGVGKLIRLSMQLYPKHNLIEFRFYDSRALRAAALYLYHRCALHLTVIRSLV